MVKFSGSIPAGSIGAFLAGAAVASVLGGAAVALTDSNFTYSPAKTGIYSIHPMDLSPSSGATSFGVGYNPALLSGEGCFNTGVNLPQGASLVDITIFYASNNQSNPTLYLDRENPATGANHFLVVRTIAEDGDVRKSLRIPIAAADKTVSNGTFAYGFGLCSGVGTEFYGARIRYTYTSAGD